MIHSIHLGVYLEQLKHAVDNKNRDTIAEVLKRLEVELAWVEIYEWGGDDYGIIGHIKDTLEKCSKAFHVGDLDLMSHFIEDLWGRLFDR